MFRDRHPTRSVQLLGLAILALFLVPTVSVAQAQRTFTVDDALNVRSASVAAATDDARWLAVTVTSARSRMGNDHFRYGDPTYVGPGSAELMVIDADMRTRP